VNIIAESISLARRLLSACAGFFRAEALTPAQRARLDEMERDYEELARRRTRGRNRRATTEHSTQESATKPGGRGH
jgi:septal ring factor EnvC (AmiA/AmiB activator)